jgi:phosphoribosylformimino-5-aminoimidazole carboxamide ribotide isomerase
MIQIIPAIDLYGGKVVRLKEGKFSEQTVYGDDPLELAKKFEAAGIERLHLVDLEGARNGKLIHKSEIEAIVAGTKLSVDVGGGIRSLSAVRELFELGVGALSVGSMPVKNPIAFAECLREFGADRFILSVDLLGDCLQVSGWQEKTRLAWKDFIASQAKSGIKSFACTDIATDGMLQGPNLGLYIEIKKSFPAINLIASGGVRNISDVQLLENIGAAGVIIGKAFYEEGIRLNQIEEFYAR